MELWKLAEALSDPQTLAALGLVSARVKQLGFAAGVPVLFAQERKHRATATLAARQLARAEGDVDVPRRDAMWVWIRCGCACDFLGQVYPPLAIRSPLGELESGWTENQAMEWLLTELWERRADTWLKLLAMEWCGPFPFYGLEAAPEGY